MSNPTTNFFQSQTDISESKDSILERFLVIRNQTEKICMPLAIEDYVVQPQDFVSPPKWHLGHTTWFFETMILLPYFKGYKVFNANYNYIFNSYYETVGVRVIRTDRGNLSRPSVEDIYLYRKYVNEAMLQFFQKEMSIEVSVLFELGLQHEQQHQELLMTDIKYILGNNPLFPPYIVNQNSENAPAKTSDWISVKEGVYEIGFEGAGFCFDNELNRHKVYLNSYQISSELITNQEYLEFINSGGYENFKFWHAEGWDWVQNQKAKAPMYWYFLLY